MSKKNKSQSKVIAPVSDSLLSTAKPFVDELPLLWQDDEDEEQPILPPLPAAPSANTTALESTLTSQQSLAQQEIDSLKQRKTLMGKQMKEATDMVKYLEAEGNTLEICCYI